MKKNKDQELYQKRQTQIANSLYELGVDQDIIKAITNIEMEDILQFRNKNTNIDKQSVDYKSKKDI